MDSNRTTPSLSSDRSLAGRRSIAPGAWLLAVLVPTAVLLAHAAYYYPFVADDALISLRYADRLLDGAGLTWTDGERVEGYSNLLWILGVAVLGGLGFDLIDASRLLGVASIVGIFVALAFAFRPRSFRWALPALVGGLGLAVSAPIAVWSIGGLEQPLVGVLLGFSFVAALPLLDGVATGPRRPLLAGVPLALLCLTRPDGPLFAAVFGLSILVLRRFARRGFRDAILLGVAPVIALAGQLAFRLAYYGDWVPNTAHMKAHVTAHSLRTGVAYLANAAGSLYPLAALALIGIFAAIFFSHRRGRALALVLSIAAWLAYVVAVGGDIFPAYRHAVPVLVLLAFLAASGVEWLVSLRVVLRVASLAGVAALLGLLAILQFDDGESQRAKHERWEWDGEAVGGMFHRAFAGAEPLYAVTAAGTLPYFSKLPALDMLGLNDRHIALREPVPGGHLGHDRGDGKYVLDRAPDLITFGVPTGGSPHFVSGGEMRRDPRFAEQYQRVTFLAREPYLVQNVSYVRRDGRIGVTTGPDEIRYPAYLLRGRGVVGELDADGKMAALLPRGVTARTQPIDLASGTWRVSLVPPNPLVEISIRNAGKVALHVASGVAAIEVPERGRVELMLRSQGVSTSVREIVLHRAQTQGSGASSPLKAGARARLRLARRSIASGAPVVLEDFEGPLAGWRVSGSAFLEQPAAGNREGQGKISGHRGKGLLNSFQAGEGDSATGVASRTFTVPEDAWLGFRIGGGRRRVGVRLLSGDRVAATWRGQTNERLRQVRRDLSPYAGKELRIEIFDENDGGWGHVLVDQIQLGKTEARPAPRTKP